MFALCFWDQIYSTKLYFAYFCNTRLHEEAEREKEKLVSKISVYVSAFISNGFPLEAFIITLQGFLWLPQLRASTLKFQHAIRDCEL